MKICNWDLTWDGEIFTGLSNIDLDVELFKRLDRFNLEGATFYSKSPQEITVSKVEELKHEMDRIKKPLKDRDFPVLDGEDPEEIDRFYLPDTIGTTRAISELLLDGTKPLVTGLKMEDFRNMRIAAMRDGGKDSVERADGKKFGDIEAESGKSWTPEQWASLEMSSWDVLTEYGTKVHAVFEDIFNGRTPHNPGLDSGIFNDLVNQVKEFKNELDTKYPEAKYYSELLIEAKEDSLSETAKAALNGAKGRPKTISGIIDLLVVDKNGNGHVFDFKVSRKEIVSEGKSPYGDALISAWNMMENVKNSHTWHSTKKLSAAYQTEIYKRMCDQWGIPVVSTAIIPIKLNLKYESSDNPLLATSIESIRVAKTEKEWIKNPIQQGGNKRAKISGIFVREGRETPEELEAASKLYNEFFPLQGWNMKREELRNSIDFYRKNTKYVDKLSKDNPHYKKYIEKGMTHVIKFPGQNPKYCKEDEINDILQDFISRRSDTSAEKFVDLANAIHDYKEGDGSIETLVGVVGKTNDAFIRNALKKYLEDDSWRLISDDTCHAIGLLIFRKGSRSEIVCLSDNHLRENTKLLLGTSILGQTKADKNVDFRKTLPALKGNLAMMRAMIYVSQHQEMFKEAPISSIKAIAPWHHGIHTVNNELLMKNYQDLIREHPGSGAKRIEYDVFMTDYESIISECQDEIEGLDLLKPGEKWYTAEWFLDKINYIKRTYSSEINTEDNEYQQTPAGHVLALLQEGYALAKGFKSHTELDKDSWTPDHWYELNGLKIASPQYSSSANIRELAQAIDEYAKEVRLRVYKIGWPMQVAFQNLYKKHGVGVKAFKSWFADPKKLLLKDPDCGDFDGDPESKEALRLFLRTMCELRHPEFTTEEQFETAKTTDELYYAVPLLEAKFSRQVSGTNLWTAIKNKFKQAKALTENLFGEEVDLYLHKNQEVYNKFQYDNIEAREQIREAHEGAFETDLELVMNAALVAFCRTNVSREYAPVIAALKVGLDRLDALGGDKNVNMKNIKETFDKIVKSKFYGDTLIPEKLQPIYKWLSMIKSMFTTLTLSLNSRSFLRESLQGIYSGIARAGFKMYPGINEKEYIEALTYVIQESPKNFSSVSMLQQLNAIYGMANQSLSQLANQRRLSWANIKHWGKDTLFITATAPDFMHRMSILVAKMKADNCFDAHSVDDKGQLVYDFKKDGRFQHFLNDEYDHPDYLKEKSLYETMIDGFNQEGFRNKDGSYLDASKKDALPQAYTRTEGQSIKNYADLLYGHYDEESKSLLYDTFLGSFFLQYKTFLTSRLEQWTIHEGQYNVANLTQIKDANGDEMYIKFYEDEDGTPHKDILLKGEYEALSEEEKKTCRLYYDYEGLPLQGMLQESTKVWKGLVSLIWDKDGAKKLKEIWKDPTTRTMFKLQLNDLWICAFLTGLVTFLFGLGEDVNEPLNPNKVRAAMKKAGPMESFAYNVISGSLADSQLFNVLGGFTGDPPMITALTRFGTSTWKLMTGDTNLAGWMTRNIGAIGDFQGMAEKYMEQK